MACIIKLIYQSTIDDQINNTPLYQLQTSDLDTAAQNILIKYWDQRILASAKKEAIKTVLRERIHADKAEKLPKLTYRANELCQQPSSFELIIDTLQKEFSSFDAYEIRLIVKCNQFIQNELLNGKTINDRYDERVSQKDRVSLFDRVHEAAKRDLYFTKKYSRDLNKTLSKTLGISTFEIDKNLYQLCFGKAPEKKLTPEKIHQILDSFDPQKRKQIYHTLTAFAAMVEKIDGLSAKDANQINELIKGLNQGWMKFIMHSSALNHLSDLLSLMKILGKSNKILLMKLGIQSKLEQKWKDKFPNEYNEFRNLLKMENIGDFSFENRIQKIQTALNSQLKKFIQNAVFSHANRLENKTKIQEYLTFFREEYDLNCVTLEHLFSALNLNPHSK